jgi:hypothetical protein
VADLGRAAASCCGPKIDDAVFEVGGRVFEGLADVVVFELRVFRAELFAIGVSG